MPRQIAGIVRSKVLCQVFVDSSYLEKKATLPGVGLIICIKPPTPLSGASISAAIEMD